MNRDKIVKFVDALQANPDKAFSLDGATEEEKNAIFEEVRLRKGGSENSMGQTPTEVDILRQKELAARDWGKMLGGLDVGAERAREANRRDASTKASIAGGIARGGTLGFADELAGVANMALGDPRTPIRNYEAGRDEYREIEGIARSENPKKFTAAEIAGGLLLPVPGSGVGRTASMAEHVAHGAKVGIPIGAAYGAGTSEKPLGVGTIDDAVEGSKLGGLGGAAGGALNRGVSKALNWWRGIPDSIPADDMIAGGLGYEPHEITKMKLFDQYWDQVQQMAQQAKGLGKDASEQAAMEVLATRGIRPPEGIGLKEAAEIARRHVKFPYSAQSAADDMMLSATKERRFEGEPMYPRGEYWKKTDIDATTEVIPQEPIQLSQHAPAPVAAPAEASELEELLRKSLEIERAKSAAAAPSVSPSKKPGWVAQRKAQEAALESSGGDEMWRNFAPDEWDAPAGQIERTVPKDPIRMSRPVNETVHLEAFEQVPEMARTPPPLMTPAERSVMDRLYDVAGGGQGVVNKQGLQQSTLAGSVRSAILGRGQLGAGVDLQQKLQRIMGSLNEQTGQGPSKLGSLVTQVMNARPEDQALLDYLFKEMHPEYNAAMLSAGSNK